MQGPSAETEERPMGGVEKGYFQVAGWVVIAVCVVFSIDNEVS